MAKKLIYFQFNGLAESIRYILSYAGEKFEDVRYEYSEWPVAEVKEKLPYGQLPLYLEGGKSLNKSIAIARYVASKTDLLPSDPWEQARLDAAVLNIYEFWQKALRSLVEKDNDKKEVLKKQALEETFPFYLSRFEKEINSNNGYLRGKLSWADFILLGIFETINLMYDITLEKDYTGISNLMRTIHELAGVKAYVATRKPYKQL